MLFFYGELTGSILKLLLVYYYPPQLNFVSHTITDKYQCATNTKLK